MFTELKFLIIFRPKLKSVDGMFVGIFSCTHQAVVTYYVPVADDSCAFLTVYKYIVKF